MQGEHEMERLHFQMGAEVPQAELAEQYPPFEAAHY